MKREGLFKLVVGVCLIAIILLSIPLISACPGPAPAPEVIKARFSGWEPPPSLAGQTIMHFFDLLNEKVGDRLQVEVFQGNTLYNYQEVRLPLKEGAVEMVDMATPGLFMWAPKFKVVTLNGVWDVDEMMTYMNSTDFKPAWDSLLEVSNSIPFAAHPFGSFCLFSTKPVSSVADFKGIRVNCQSQEAVDIVNALGGSAGQVAVSDIYTALQQGMYDATISNPSVALGFGFGEFTKYACKEPWLYGINFILVNKDFWDSLPVDIQDAFKEASEETTEWSLAFAPQGEAQQFAMLEEQWGLEYFTIKDWDKIVEAAQTDVWPEIREDVGADFFDTALKYAEND